MRELSRAEMLKILYKMGEFVSCPHEFFNPFRHGKKMPKDWYTKYSWTPEQESRFEKWLIKLIQKKSHMPKKWCEKEAKYITFDYGWSYKVVQ